MYFTFPVYHLQLHAAFVIQLIRNRISSIFQVPFLNNIRRNFKFEVACRIPRKISHNNQLLGIRPTRVGINSGVVTVSSLTIDGLNFLKFSSKILTFQSGGVRAAMMPRLSGLFRVARLT